MRSIVDIVKTEIKARFCAAPGGRRDDEFLRETHLTVVCMPTAEKERDREGVLLTNVHYTARVYLCVWRYVCTDAVRPIHFAIRLYYIARFTPRIESHDPPRVRSSPDTCKVYLCPSACLPG